jgi:2-polyprenyl-6-methoxyphenol hydroxylase-like FAD-dependent oxidoreductase
VEGAETRKAVICGAGIAGLTLAWWLDRSSWEVTLLEQAPRLRDEGYMIDFFGPGYQIAGLMGLLPRLEAWTTTLPAACWTAGCSR